jgi:hypothetical protein
MKSLVRFLQRAAVVSAIALCVGCESDEPKRKVVGPSEDLSGLPWNRPRSFENTSGIGRALPQSH